MHVFSLVIKHLVYEIGAKAKAKTFFLKVQAWPRPRTWKFLRPRPFPQGHIVILRPTLRPN